MDNDILAFKTTDDIYNLKPQYPSETQYFSENEMYRKIIKTKMFPKSFLSYTSSIFMICLNGVNNQIKVQNLLFCMEVKMLPLFTFSMLNILICESAHSK